MSQQMTHVKMGQHLGVTRNLAEALRYLRFKDKPRVMWIDAICVDQQNLEERGRQVQRMADIYRNAERVVIWIDPASDDSALAIETLKTLGSRIKVNWTLLEMESSAGEDSHCGDLGFNLTYTNEIWTSIHSLIRRPWFKRLWIWQEVLLALMAVIHCGYETLDWNSFGKAIYCIHQKDSLGYSVDLETWGDFDDILSHLYDLVITSRDNQPPLQWLLEYTRACECNDPRDRIYALLNLSHKTPALMGLQPDYTQEPRDCYQEVVLRYLTREGTLNILAHCEWHGDIVSKPSWVPDWSKPQVSRRITHGRTCFGSRAKAKIAGKGVLIVTALYCAEICDIGRIIFAGEAVVNTNYPDLIRVIRRLAQNFNFSTPYVDGSSVTEAFCRTLCVNDFSDGFLPAASAFPDFYLSLAYLQNILRELSSEIEPYGPFLNLVRYYLNGRHLFTTKEGYIGLAPQAVETGDRVCAILGCQLPMLLRSEGDERYVVIGDCYIHGLMNGEALLGQLSQEWRYAIIYVDRVGHVPGFVNQQTGENVFEDPRFGQLPPGWRLEDEERRADWNNWFVNDETGEEMYWPQDPRMTAEALSARSVPLQEFLLE